MNKNNQKINKMGNPTKCLHLNHNHNNNNNNNNNNNKKSSKTNLVLIIRCLYNNLLI